MNISIRCFLPKEEGPGFNSTPDMIKSFWVTLDKTNRYANIIKDSIMVLVFKFGLKGTMPLLEVNFCLEKVPILDLYWLMSIEAPMSSILQLIEYDNIWSSILFECLFKNYINSFVVEIKFNQKWNSSFRYHLNLIDFLFLWMI